MSPRERQVVFMAADGLVDKEIAERMGVTNSTIRTYWSRLRKKTRGANKVQTVVLALKCLDRADVHRLRLSLESS